MSSTRVISLEFDCRRPGSVAEALEALQVEGARVLAGGTDLLNAIKVNLLRPSLLVYVLGIEELARLGWEEGRSDEAGGTAGPAAGAPGSLLRIGAAVRLRTLELDPEVGARFPALREAVNVIGGTQIRNLATLAGNLCNASPGADTAPVLLVRGAEVEIAAAAARRRLPLERFFTGPKRTALERGEMLTAVLLPAPPPNSGAAFRRLARVSLDIAKINCAAYLERDGERVARARVALGSVGPTPLRAPQVEQALEGRKGGAELFRAAAERVAGEIAPITDVRSTEQYRRRMAGVLVREALEGAWKRAGGR